MKNLRYPSTSLIKDIEKQTTKNGGLLYFKKNLIHDGFISYIDIISSSRKNRDLLMSLLFGDLPFKIESTSSSAIDRSGQCSQWSSVFCNFFSQVLALLDIVISEPSRNY